MKKLSTICAFALCFIGFTAGLAFAQACTNDQDCDDGLYCNGTETCVSNECVSDISPCDDEDLCSTDPCDEDNDTCLTHECAATSPADPCCNDPLCGAADLCTARVTLIPKDVWAIPGEEVKEHICLDNLADLVGGIQFDLCEYSDGQPSDCTTCVNCELTGRTSLFDCAVNELANGCCAVLVFSTNPGGVIIPGHCDIVKVVYELEEDCVAPNCSVHIPQNIIAVDDDGFILPAYGYQGVLCVLSPDTDGDGVPDDGGDHFCTTDETTNCDDNCPYQPNGPGGGTCTAGATPGYPCTIAGSNISECGEGGFCSMAQEDSNDNGIGDACECASASDCDDGLYCNGTETCDLDICYPGSDPCAPLFCNEEDDTCLLECVTNADCDDGLYCTGSEACVSNTCVSDIAPCDDEDLCTTDPCDEDSDTCLTHGCAAISPADPCCEDFLCENTDLCEARITLKPKDVWAIPGEVVKEPICLDNLQDVVGAIQFDVCEYSDDQPSDCMTCIDCELTGRTELFACAVNELTNGCCAAILYSAHPGGLINPGQCNIVTIVYELDEDCVAPNCSVHIPQNIIAVDDDGFILPAYGYQGVACILSPDTDGDGFSDEEDNCPLKPNGPGGGTCTAGTTPGDPCTIPGNNSSECGEGGFCSMAQEDSNDNGIGDACECENDMDCDDGLYCTGTEICVSNRCVPDISPCDDENPCSTDPCDEDSDICLAKECAATSPADSCCTDSFCEGVDLCAARITLRPEDVTVLPGEIFVKPICLDNRGGDLVGGIQFDLCEYIDGEPSDCVTCIDCELTGRTTLFSCVVNELANGCCAVLLYSMNPGGLINPGLCDIVNIFEFHKDCTWPICTLQIPENITARDAVNAPLPAYGFPGEVCFSICTTDEDCDDGLYCNGFEVCVDEICQLGVEPCPDDGNDCTDDICDEDTNSCRYPCNISIEDVCDLSEHFHQCCNDPVCAFSPLCNIRGTIEIGNTWANCGDVGVKIPVCLVNLQDEVGAVQLDLCEDINDCLICVGCEMTERTTIFDCMVNELENGCCAVVVFSKNPGGVINPGECDIVIIDYTLKDEPQCCSSCIEIGGEQIEVVDQYGYLVETIVCDTGMVCPFECGDVEPPATTATSWDCGDGNVDIFDILEEVDFIIHVKDPDDCQAVRADVPTGTPPYCDPPDGTIDVGDLMVIIDMALNRQDCCSYYSGGVIY